MRKVSAYELRNILSNKARDVPRAVRKAIEDTGLQLQGKLVQQEIDRTVPHPPVDMAGYRGGFRGRPTAAGYLVYNITRQALWIERGRGPGGNPGSIYRVIKAWARRKGIPNAAWPIAVKIAHEGYRPRWVMRRASQRVRPVLRAAIRRALGRHLSEKR